MTELVTSTAIAWVALLATPALVLVLAVVHAVIRRQKRIAAMRRLRKHVETIKLGIGREFAPALEGLAADLTEWIRENEP